MLIVIRNEEKVSSKASFIINIWKKNLQTEIIYVYRKESQKFLESFSDKDIILHSTTKGILLYYLLLILKSPKDLRNGLMFRLSFLKRKHLLTENGFLSMLSSVLVLQFGTTIKDEHLIRLLNKVKESKFFIIDEFLSLNCIDLKKIRLLGPIIYVSSDIASNRFGYGDNLITKKLMFRLERDAMPNIDLVIACSEMERLKYLEMGARNAIFYPNIYPTGEFKPCKKDEMLTVCIVLRSHWGLRAEKSLEIVLSALACQKKQIKVYVIGVKPTKIPKNIILEHYEFLESKNDYLKILSKSWVGINFGIHMAGTNERKYDYGEAGIVVFSDLLGARGDFLPHEYVFVDGHDLAAKIAQVLEFGKKQITEMGEKNRKHVLSIAAKQEKHVIEKINQFVSKFN